MKPEPIFSTHNKYFFFSFSLPIFLQTVASFSLPSEAESLACTIYKFQRNTGNKKASCIDSAFQKLVNRLAATMRIDSHLLDVPKKKIRITAFASSRFYDSSYLIDGDKFPATISRFKEMTANFQGMDLSLQQLITKAVIFAVATAVVTIQGKHKSEMLFLREMIMKSLLLRNSPSTNSPPNPNASPKAHLGTDSLSKTTTKRLNQVDLGYFDPHLDKVYGEDEIVLVRKDVYYTNVMLFVQCLWSFVTFQRRCFCQSQPRYILPRRRL